MATQVQNRRGSTAEHSAFAGAVGELTVDTDKDVVVVHDGATAGGHPMLKQDLSNLPAGTIDNADINASAAIAGTKISPDFGSQNTTTTGTSTAASFIPTSSTVPANGVYLPAANSVALATNGTQRLAIDANGNVNIDSGTLYVDAVNNRVSIGTTSPGGKLHIFEGSSGQANPNAFANTLVIEDNASSGISILTPSTETGSIFFGDEGDNFIGGIRYDHVDNSFQLYANNAERARIDSSGRLLVGTSTSRSSGSSKFIQQERAGTTEPHPGVAFIANANDAGFAPAINLCKTRGTSVGSNTVIQNGDNLGYVTFNGADGSDLNSYAAWITCQVDGTPGNNDMPGRLVFSTTADGASSPTERLRINNTGALGLSGANFGTQGQALISNGSTAPPTWQSVNTPVFGWNHTNDAYGLYLPGTSISAGALSGTVDIDVQSRLRRCVINDAGVVQYYLDADDSTLKAGDWLRIVETESLTTAYTGTTTEATNSLLRVGVPAWARNIAFTRGQRVTYGGFLWELLAAATANVTAGAFVVGVTYEIVAVGTTDFTLIGAASNTVGVTFTATGVGTGTGTATAVPQAGVVASVLDGTDGQIVVEVPAFSVKYGFLNGVHTREIRLGCSDSLIAQGFQPHTAFIRTDGTYKTAFYWGAYHASNAAGNIMASVSGQTNTRSLTRAVFRTRSVARGTNWHVISYLEQAAIQTLLVTEYRDHNSQKVVGNGSNAGTTYGVTTGQSNARGNRSANSTGNVSVADDYVSYRGIENLYGRAWQWVDGFNVYERVVYLTNNQSAFADNTSVGYRFYAQVPTGSSSYQKEIFPLPDVFLPSVVTGASDTSYLGDAFWTNTGWRVAFVGGASDNGALVGAFALHLSDGSGAAYASVGSRLSYAQN